MLHLEMTNIILEKQPYFVLFLSSLMHSIGYLIDIFCTELDKAQNVFVDCLAKIERMARASNGPSKEIGNFDLTVDANFK